MKITLKVIEPNKKKIRLMGVEMKEVNSIICLRLQTPCLFLSKKSANHGQISVTLIF